MEKVEEKEDSTLYYKGMCVHYHCNRHELVTVPVLIVSINLTRCPCTNTLYDSNALTA
jgi:hypothetical protein